MMNLTHSVVTHLIKRITRILCNIDDTELVHVPTQGPLIIASNHINFVEVPILYTHLQPRQVIGFAKAETWENPAMGFLFNLWGAIPVQRGEADHGAMKSALIALRQGKILAIAPEGTRSGDGRLNKGHPGIVMLAYYSHAPILPLAFFGGERIHDNLSRLKRTDFTIRVGRPFNLKFTGHKKDRDERNNILTEIMYQIASLLPESYRGHYSELTHRSIKYLDFV